MEIEKLACEFNSLEKRLSGQFTSWKPKWVGGPGGLTFNRCKPRPSIAVDIP